MEKLHTPKGKSYWSNNAAYTEQYEELHQKLVPVVGKAETVNGEVLRVLSNVSYDYYNNGNCNILTGIYETCDHCDGSGFEEEEECTYCDGTGEHEDGEECCNCGGTGHEELEDCHQCGGNCTTLESYKIEKHWQDMIDFLHQYLTNNSESKETSIEILEKLEDQIKEKGMDCEFTDDEQRVYVDLADEVIYTVLNTEDKKI